LKFGAWFLIERERPNDECVFAGRPILKSNHTIHFMTTDHHPLDIDWLRDFAALVDIGNFSRAADARAISQPALSRHIRAIEDWVGVPLIDRGSQPVELTPAGRTFFPIVQSSLANIEAARIKARATHDQESATLRFACTHALSLTFFPRWLASLEGKRKFSAVQTFSDTFRGCEALMNQRQVQFVLSYANAAQPNGLDAAQFPMRTLGSDVLCPVCTYGADSAPLFSLDKSTALPLLAYGDESALSHALSPTLARLTQSLSQRDARPGLCTVFTAHHAFLIKAMALEGRGVAWLPRSLIEDELREKKLVAAGADAWNVPLSIRLYRQKSAMSSPAEAIWDALA
jgi:LysR family transcriptional regulator, hypochlorite-specific transcription factor HypT